MNNLNASLEASKRLVDAGIILETDFIYNSDGKLLYSPLVERRDGDIPAPSMEEVWRELPEQHDGEYLRLFKDEGKTFCGYGEYADRWGNENPADALIDLLIFVRKEQGNENIGII